MLRNSILVLAGLATVGGVLVANPQDAWARRRCCCGGGYGGGYYGGSNYGTSYYGGTSANYGAQTYDGTAPAPADGAVPYGTNYGPQGGSVGAPGAQGYYDNAGVWHAYGPAGATVQGGTAVQGGAAVRGNVDAQGRPINPNQATPRANTNIREDGSARTNIQANPGNGAARGNAGARTNIDGNVRSSTGAAPPPPPAPAAPAAPSAPKTPPRDE